MIYVSKHETPLGMITIAGTKENLVGVWFDNQKYFGSTIPKEHQVGETKVIKETKKWLDIYFSGVEPDFFPLLLMEDSFFRMQVWEILKTIPYNQTKTYKEVGRQVAKKRNILNMSAQAVGGAVGKNPFAILIPCHRVIGKNGDLKGYAGGIQIKKQLLDLEKNEINRKQSNY